MGAGVEERSGAVCEDAARGAAAAAGRDVAASARPGVNAMQSSAAANATEEPRFINLL